MLAELQSRLEGHFALLADQRSSRGYPLYALEHGLSADEIEKLCAALNDDLSKSRMVRPRYWLSWIVFAAEVGYAYDGDEYWTSFQNRIAAWQRFGDRDVIREFFRKFAEKYSGFTPQGRFAEHFTIIAWPIAHSILPQDLQQRFARHLHEVRYELADQIDHGIAGITRVLSTGSHGGSSRYQNLLQQTDLLAHVILALRDQDIDDAVHPIYKPTLSRIVGDIERRRVASRWLRETTRILRERRTNVSIDFRKPDRRLGGEPGKAATQVGVRLAAQRQTDGGWTLGVTIPDIRTLFRLGGLNPKLLDDTRIRMFDVTDSWRPGRALMAMSGREIPITKLPSASPSSVIITENAPKVDALFATALSIVGEAPWLMRVQDDGIARQVLGKHIRSSECYVVITRSPLDADVVRDLGAVEQAAPTSGAMLYVIDVGDQITDRQLSAISRAQLGFSVRVKIDPVGLLPRLDGEIARTVWLPDEELLLRISADHQVVEFVVSVDEGETLRIQARGRKEVIVSAGTLPLGHHVISVQTISAVEGRPQQLKTESGDPISVEVRSPMPWQSAVGMKAGFHAVVDPPGARLEQLINDRARISVLGPAGRTVHVEAVTRDPNGHETATYKIGNVKLPSDRPAMRGVLDHLKDESVSDAIMSSPHIDLRFKVEELGVSSIGFPHEVQPLRWKREVIGGISIARLVDEVGKEEDVRIDRYDIIAPDRRIPLDRIECSKGVEIPYPGSLLAVKLKGKWTSRLIGSPMAQKHVSLRDIGVDIWINLVDPKMLGRLIWLYRLWTIARPLGPLASIRKSKVLTEFEDRIARSVCGERWLSRSKAFRESSGDEESVAALQKEVGGSQGFAARIREMPWGPHGTGIGALSVEFARHAATYGICEDADLCGLALRLAFEPGKIPISNSPDEIAKFVTISQNGPLARGAFFASAIADRLPPAEAISAEREAS